MKKHTSILSSIRIASTVALALVGGTAAMAQFAPLPLTSSSYTYDIVVESNFIYKASEACVTATMDGGPARNNNTWYEAGLDMAFPTTGLPHAGTVLTSVSQSDHSYQLAPTWFSNNVVFLGDYDTNYLSDTEDFTNGSITPSTPKAYTAISVLTSAGNGPVVLNVAVTHADGTTDSGITSFTVPDWFNSVSGSLGYTPPGNLAYVAGGRITPVGGGFNNVPSTNTMNLWTVDLPLADTASPVTNVAFTFVSGGRCAIFAISGSTTSGGTGPFTPIAFSATNFNADMVVEAETSLPFTATMDNGTNVFGTNGSTGNTWFEAGYLPSSPIAGPNVPLTNGIPAHGSTFTSGAFPAVYQMAPSYSAPNAILINTNIQSASLTPTSPTAAAALSFLVGGANMGSGNSMTNLCIVKHQDGTSETNFVYGNDWFNNSLTPAWIANGRVQFDAGRELNNFGNPTNSGNDPRLFDSVVYLKDTTSPITNITLQYYNPANGYGTSWNTYILAVSADTKTAPIVATIPPFALSDLGGTTTIGPPQVLGSGVTYQWYKGSTAISGATDATYTTPTSLGVGSNIYSVTVSNSVASTNLPVIVLVGSSLLYNDSFWTINNNATGYKTFPFIANNIFQPTDNNGGEAGSAFLNNPVPVNGFTAAWTYRDVTGGGADGMSFVLQNDATGAKSLGGAGGSLGVAGITPSAEIDFDLYPNNSPLGGNNGGYQYNTGGATPSGTAAPNPYFSCFPVQVASGDPINVIVNYNFATGVLQLTMIDTAASTLGPNAGFNDQTFTTNITVGDLTALLGVTNAFVGFTGADGGATSTQIISNFFYIPVQETLSAAVSPPTISAEVDEPVTFTAVPVGSPPYTFQWSYDGTAVAGATNSTFGTNATTADAGTYSVLVGSGTLTAKAQGTLTVSTSVAATLPLTNTPVFAGVSKILTVTAYGQPPLTYQWFNGSTPIAGATNSTFSIPTNLAAGSYNISVAVSNATSFEQPTVAVTVAPITAFAKALSLLNPISYWPLNETNGTIAYDYFGYNDGTYTGGYTLGTAGIPGPAFGETNYSVSFDGFSAYVDIPVGNLNITNSITVMIMLQASGVQPQFASAFDHTDEGWRISYDTSGFAHFAEGNGSGDSDATGSTDLTDNNWHLITGVYNAANSNCDVYVDGLFVAGHQDGTPPIGSQDDVWIGGAPDYGVGPGRLFQGNLADAVVIPSALDAAQIQAVYYAGDFPPAVAVAATQFVGDLDGSVSLTATTNGTPPLSLQWYYINPSTGSISAVAGQTNATLTLSDLQQSQQGLEYFISAKNLYGSANNSNSPTILTTIESGAPNITVDIAPLSLLAALGGQQTFDVTVFGTAPLVYQWYEDGNAISGATTSSYTFTVAAGTNTYNVIITNSVGIANSSTSSVVAAPSGSIGFYNPADWTINTDSTFTTQPNITDQVFYGTDGGGSEGCTAWYNNLVFINGFTVSFTYQDVGGSPGNNADGESFTLQESGPTYVNGGGGSLAISGLTPSADWEFNLYASTSPHIIGIYYNTDGTTGTYDTTGTVNISSGDPISITIQYSPGGAVTETLFDKTSQDTFTTNYNIGDLTALLGSSYAYMGFSSADGGVASVQTVSDLLFISTPPATGPVLSITRGTGDTILITWPSTTATSYVLQQASSLPGTWANVSTTPTVVGANYQVSVTATPTEQYFRLVSP
jgi:hypothetical protein